MKRGRAFYHGYNDRRLSAVSKMNAGGGQQVVDSRCQKQSKEPGLLQFAFPSKGCDKGPLGGVLGSGQEGGGGGGGQSPVVLDCLCKLTVIAKDSAILTDSC